MPEHAVTFAGLSAPDKLRIGCASAISIAAFATVGWMIMAPPDPEAAVSLLTHDRPLMMIVQVTGLALGLAAVASAIGPLRVPGVAVFAVAIGLAAAVTRGGKMDMLLADFGGPDPADRGRLCMILALEVLVWFFPVLVAFFVESLVRAWLGDRSDDAARTGRRTSPARPHGGSQAARGWLGWIGGDEAAARQELASGLMAGGICAVAGFVLVRLTATGSPVAAIEKGQVYFSIALGFYVGGLLAQYWCSTRLAFWCSLSVPVVAVV